MEWLQLTLAERCLPRRVVVRKHRSSSQSSAYASLYGVLWLVSRMALNDAGLAANL